MASGNESQDLKPNRTAKQSPQPVYRLIRKPAMKTMVKPTINAEHHELLKAFHKPTNNKGMIVILPEAAYGDWLTSTPEQSMEFMHPYPHTSSPPMPQRNKAR